MREEMRECENYEAVMTAVANISNLLDEGPPTFQEKLLDFLGRFGIVIFFFMSSVFLAVCGEYRERNRRLKDAMTMSALDDIDKEKANMLQQDFKTEIFAGAVGAAPDGPAAPPGGPRCTLDTP